MIIEKKITIMIDEYEKTKLIRSNQVKTIICMLIKNV